MNPNSKSQLFETDRYTLLILCMNLHLVSLVVQTAKNLLAVQETRVRLLGGEDLLEEGMQPTPVFLPGESHEQRSLVGYSIWGHKE